MPAGKHEHIKTYDLEPLRDDILNDKLFGFIQVDIETPDHLKENSVKCALFSRMKKSILKI